MERGRFWRSTRIAFTPAGCRSGLSSWPTTGRAIRERGPWDRIASFWLSQCQTAYRHLRGLCRGWHHVNWRDRDENGQPRASFPASVIGHVMGELAQHPTKMGLKRGFQTHKLVAGAGFEPATFRL